MLDYVLCSGVLVGGMRDRWEGEREEWEAHGGWQGKMLILILGDREAMCKCCRCRIGSMVRMRHEMCESVTISGGSCSLCASWGRAPIGLDSDTEGKSRDENTFAEVRGPLSELVCSSN